MGGKKSSNQTSCKSFLAWVARVVKKKKKNLPANNADVRDVGSVSGLRRIPGGGHGNPLQ